MTHRSPVYLDRDGVINENSREYVKSIDEWIPIPGAIEAIARLSRAGHRVVVVTNQSAVARKFCSEGDVLEIHRHMRSLVEEAGGIISGIFYCPHHPEDDCECRKPRTGLIDRAREELGLPEGGYIVGDAGTDMELGRRSGLKTILVLTGRGIGQLSEIKRKGYQLPWKVADDIGSAVDIILEDSITGSRPRTL